MSDYLLVHGAFNSGWVWDAVTGQLQAGGHRAHVVEQLPSGGTEPAALGDLSADVDHVRGVLETTAEPVVLVGHSYGGMVITEFADHPKVRHSVYLTALWPKRGQSVLNQLGDVLPNVFVWREDGAMEMADDFELAWKSFCPDLARDQGHMVLSRFVLQSATSYCAPSMAPERMHPATYVIATQESANSVVAQEAWSANADHVVRISAGHMVQLSRPRELAEVLGRI
nr:alpha/beta hydrolase [Mycolicibacterium komanii]CRL75436.1 esterase EstC [Mycolicibacterium komanii]